MGEAACSAAEHPPAGSRRQAPLTSASPNSVAFLMMTGRGSPPSCSVALYTVPKPPVASLRPMSKSSCSGEGAKEGHGGAAAADRELDEQSLKGEAR
jgi:hypothetical protein